MAKFSYKARTPSGQIVTGILEATDEKGVSQNLRSQKLFIIAIHEKTLTSFATAVRNRIGGIGLSAITNFTRQLSVMISSGLTLSESLAVLHNQTQDKRFQKLLSDLRQSIEGGMSFSKALAQHKDVFSHIYIALIESGETAGVLDKILNRLADNLEKEREFKAKTKGMLLYPFIILIGIGIVIAIMMIFVVPQLSIVYDQLSIQLPFTTRIIISISRFFSSFWYLILIFLVGCYVGFSYWKSTEEGKAMFGAIILKLPVWAKIETEVNLTEITRTLGLMVGAGTPIIDALTEVGEATTSPLFSEAMLRSARKVEKGVSIASAFAQEPIFPPLLAQMTRVGEETGKLDEVMTKVSSFYEAEVDRDMKTVPTVLEPLILAALGLVVGFLMFSMFLPIYDITKGI